VLAQFPTDAYAREAGLDSAAYENFVYNACHADADTPTRGLLDFRGGKAAPHRGALRRDTTK